MRNLKPYYDAAQAADAEVQRIMGEIDAAFGEGTPEGKDKALALREQLDSAKAKAQDANQLYISMRDASLVDDNAAARFTAPADPAADPEDVKAKRVLKRDEFDALDHDARSEFMRRGGTVAD